MKIWRVQEAPEPGLAGALEKFEEGFAYPLGPGRRFSISHGHDYARFFRAIDGRSGASFVALDGDGEVRGTIGVAVRPLLCPDGEDRKAAYLGDLKTVPGVGRGRTLLRLASEATAWSRGHGAVCAYAVVMDGTERLPSAYTGKFGIHAFREMGKLGVLRIPAPAQGEPEDAAFASTPEAVAECFRHLSTGAFASLGGDPAVRSAMAPAALLAPDGLACGMLEDTRRAKRLLLDGGAEMAAAHLSKFAYRDPSSGVRLLRQALARCTGRGAAPAMFVAIAEDDRAALLDQLGEIPGTVEATATIFATEIEASGERWKIATSEI